MFERSIRQGWHCLGVCLPFQQTQVARLSDQKKPVPKLGRSYLAALGQNAWVLLTLIQLLVNRHPMPSQIAQSSKPSSAHTIAALNVAIVLLLAVRLAHVPRVLSPRPEPVEAPVKRREVAAVIAAMPRELGVGVHAVLLPQVLTKVVASLKSHRPPIPLAPLARVALLRLVDLAVARQRILAGEKSLAHAADERLVFGFPRVVLYIGDSCEVLEALRTRVGGQGTARGCKSALRVS
jgi:hypothetical protein